MRLYVFTALENLHWTAWSLIFQLLFFTIPPSASAEPVSEPAVIARGILPERDLKRAELGINAFVNDLRFGSISQQFREVRDELGLTKVRVLLAWNEQVQPTPTSPIDFSFYDDIIGNLPPSVTALVILTGVPSWMSDSDNWVAGNPRTTFVENWVRPVVARYKKKRRIKAWQIWNEPNNDSDPLNAVMQVVNSPENYVEMLARASNVIDELTPRKKVVSAATTSITQNYPETFAYNEGLRDAGIENFCDIVALHFYGENLERIIFGGIGDFISEIKKPIWVTESGEGGINNQEEYAREFWPYLFSEFPTIKRLYIYQFTEAKSADETYGLKNLTPGFTVSDLYIYLRDELPRKR